MRNVLTGMALLILPIGLTYILISWNQSIALDSFPLLELNSLIFRWVTLAHVIWIICGILAGIFYIYVIFVKGYWIYILGIFAQVFVFVAVWMFWLVLNGRVFVFQSVSVEEDTYHVVAHNVGGSGYLYLFSCDEGLCQPQEIGYIDSISYWDADMTYDETSHTIYVTTDLGFDIEEIVIPLDDGS